MSGTDLSKIAQKAEESLRKGRFNYVKTGLAFFFLSAASSALCLIWTGAWLVASALFVMPFYFMILTLSSAYALEEVDANNRLSIRQAMAYFHRPFFGCFRIFWNFLKSLLAFVGTLSVTLILYWAIARGTDPLFASDYALLEAAWMQGDSEGFYKILNESMPLLHFVHISITIAFGAGYFFFLFWMVNYAMSPYISVIFKDVPPSFTRYFYNRYFSLARGPFWKLLFFHGKGILFAVPLAFILGASSSFLFAVDFGIAMAMGLGASSLVLAIYLPYFALLADTFFTKNKRLFYQTQVNVSETMVRRAQATPGVDQETLAGIQKDYEESKKHLESVDESEDE